MDNEDYSKYFEDEPETKSPVQQVQIRAYVKKITDRKRGRIVFMATTYSSSKTITAICPFFCPLANDDIIFMTAPKAEYETGNITLSRSPLVTINPEEAVVEACMRRAFFKYYRGKDLETRVALLMQFLLTLGRKNNNKDRGGEVIDKQLQKISEEYHYTKSQEILGYFKGILNTAATEGLLKYWFKQRVLRKLYLYGLTLNEIRETDIKPTILYERILDDPFTLASLDMVKAKAIYTIQDRTPDDKQITMGNIIRWLYQHCKRQHNGYVKLTTFKYVFPDFVPNKELEEEYGLHIDEFNKQVTLESIYRQEAIIAEAHKLMVQNHNYTDEYKQVLLKQIEDKLQQYPHLSEDQRDAARTILSERWSLLTGPPGSGKTTILNTLIRILVAEGKRVLLLSFTGKAVSRIKEVISIHEIGSEWISIQTINRFLVTVSSSTPHYDHVFIDESSMVNIPLVSKLIEVLELPYSITFIGDLKQLYPISWGSVLESLLKTKIPHCLLTKVHRTTDKDTNGIYYYSQAIRQNQKVIEKKFGNFQFVRGELADINKILTMLLSKGVSLKDICILCPYNKYLDDLNELMRSKLGATHQVIDKIKHKSWRVGDRVILTKNNYDIGVMNGEEGLVVKLYTDKIEVLFDKVKDHEGKSKSFEFFLDTSDEEEDLGMDDESFSGELTVKYLMHSFALTIHKSQGSEWSFVILFIPYEVSKGKSFIDQAITLVAISRASKGCIVIGNIDVFIEGCNTPVSPVLESLSMRIEAAVAGEPLTGKGLGDAKALSELVTGDIDDDLFPDYPSDEDE